MVKLLQVVKAFSSTFSSLMFPLGATSVCLATVLCLATPLSGCVVRLTNSERSVDTSFRKIYLPAATDISARGGHAGRLSAAVRRAFALDTRFELTSLEDARWALDVQIKDSMLAAAKTEECKLGTEVLASGSYACTQVLENFNQPEISSEEEQLLLDIDVRAIDLNTGKSLRSLRFEKVASGAFPVVGDADIRARLRATPELHALRYVENVDNATDTIASNIAAQIIASMLTLDPSAAASAAAAAGDPAIK